LLLAPRVDRGEGFGDLVRMANLLGAKRDRPGDAALALEPVAPLAERLAGIVRLARRGRAGLHDRDFEAVAPDLEELDGVPSRLAALALLASIDIARRALLEARPLAADGTASPGAELAGGDYVCHRPGRSLATGEAEIASRGYFDVGDRPPLATWLGLLAPAARGRTPGPGADAGSEAGSEAGSGTGSDADAEVWIVAWVPPESVARVEAGCRACPNRALVPLVALAPEAHRRLRDLEREVESALQRADGL